MTLLADKHQPLVGAISLTGVSAHRATCARVVGIHFDSHRPMQERFVGNHALQLSKRPFGGSPIGLPLLLARFLAFLASGSLPNAGQIFQSNQTVRVAGHDALGDHMIGVGF